MGPSFFCLIAGALAILVRRPFARHIKASQEFLFDQAYDVDGLAWWIGAMGGLVVAFGVVFLAIWAFD